VTRARRLIPLSEIRDIADFLQERNIPWDTISVSDKTVTFSRLPKPPSTGMVPPSREKPRTAYDDHFGSPSGN
jgi:hypothetical protein